MLSSFMAEVHRGSIDSLDLPTLSAISPKLLELFTRQRVLLEGTTETVVEEEPFIVGYDAEGVEDSQALKHRFSAT